MSGATGQATPSGLGIGFGRSSPVLRRIGRSRKRHRLTWNSTAPAATARSSSSALVYWSAAGPARLASGEPPCLVRGMRRQRGMVLLGRRTGTSQPRTVFARWSVGTRPPQMSGYRDTRLSGSDWAGGCDGHQATLGGAAQSWAAPLVRGIDHRACGWALGTSTYLFWVLAPMEAKGARNEFDVGHRTAMVVSMAQSDLMALPHECPISRGRRRLSATLDSSVL